jgi:murein DD-endopeptidase MepM/ murein hydrolase activator NlpD
LLEESYFDKSKNSENAIERMKNKLLSFYNKIPERKINIIRKYSKYISGVLLIFTAYTCYKSYEYEYEVKNKDKEYQFAFIKAIPEILNHKNLTSDKALEKNKKEKSNKSNSLVSNLKIEKIKNIFNSNSEVKLKKYTIKKGDTLLSISQETGIDVSVIIENNPKFKKKKQLKVGRTLDIPTRNGLYYTLKKKDSVEGVAQKYGVDVDDITQISDNDDGDSEITVFVENPDLISSKKNEISEVGEYRKNKRYFGLEDSTPTYNIAFTTPCRWRGVNSSYGVRIHPVLKRKVFHEGVDLKGYTGDPVYAAKAGVILFAGKKSGYGNLIIIGHGNGYTTRYGHLNSIAVRKGDEVSKNDCIGEIGSTGRSTGPHLHFEIRKNGESINPLTYIQKKYSKSKKSKHNKTDIDKIICKISKKVGIDERLVMLVADAESEKNQGCVSNRGAIGIMQLMPNTARSLGVNPYDVEENIEGGARYLKTFLKQYNGDIALTLAAYNAGPDNVRKYGGIPPFKETRAYVDKITKEYYDI